MKIILSTPKEVVIVKEIKKTISEITIYEIIDSPENKTIRANTLELGSVMLWQGITYDSIGQWTDADVQKRILELINE